MDNQTTAFHVGMTADAVIDAAAELTRDSHLWGWSIRDLARRLDVSPSVIYHHVGGRDRLARGVVERVVDGLSVPPPESPWDKWFCTFLISAYGPVTAYPGVAKWLLLHGPTFRTTLDVIDTGTALLRRAGFGDDAGFAYAALLNNAMLTISIGDDRLVHEDDGPRDHATMMDEFARTAVGRPGVEVLTASLLTPFAEGGSGAERLRERYFRFVVDTTIAGLATLLDIPAATVNAGTSQS
ncbi:helix-turn-helix transcriptional regulator [uncultured Microbacterium sp.]|uniref:TetR/AcrR family transcriptional regulator n=1 Tax=uncultured Microbacterium sp. TaxID=191216 RepID=UPI0028D50677|nr:helix-turn-helix transcriptional regulator [uncultured Microbacterium sp.]